MWKSALNLFSLVAIVAGLIAVNEITGLKDWVYHPVTAMGCLIIGAIVYVATNNEEW